MATKKISEFTNLGSLSDNDILPVVSGGANKKITASVLKTYAQAGGGTSLPTDAAGFLKNDGTGTLSWASAPATLMSANGTYEVTLDDTGALVLSSYGVVKNPDHVNIVSDGWAQLQWVDTETLTNADPNATSGPTNWIYVDQNGIHVETNINSNINDSTQRYDWNFDIYGNLTMPVGGDIKDSNGNSVLGGGGLSLPANASGYLTNDGAGNLAWAAGDGTFSGDYNDLTNTPFIPASLSDFGITAGSNGQVLTLNSSLVPVWATPSGGGQTFDQDLNTTNDVTFNKVTVTDIVGIENNDGYRITNTYSDGTMYVNGSNTQTPVSILIAGAGPRNEWAFTPDGKLTLPEIGTGIGWTNTDSAPTPDTGFLYSSTISFDKTQGIVLTNNVAGTDTTWVIGKDGKIKLPAGGDIVDSNGNSVLGGGSGPTNEITNTDGDSTWSVSVSETGIVTMITARGSLEFGAQPEVGAPTHLHIMRPAGQEGSNDLYFGDDYNYVRLPGLYGEGSQGVEIGSSYNSETPNVWRFETWGDLTAPGGITANGTIAGNGLRINNENELTFDQNGSVITEQRPGEGYNFYATDTVAVTGNGSGAKLNISFGAGDESYQVSVNDGGTYSYLVGDQLKVTGDALGGVTPDNDLLVTVSQLYPGDNGNPWAVFGVTIDSGTPVGYQDGLHIRTNGNEWTFGTDGSIRLPSKGSVETVDNGVTVKHSNYAQLQSNDSYVWVESHSASVEVDNNQWDFNSDGSMTLPNNVVQNTGGTISVSNGAPTVIYTTTSSDRHTVKLLVQAEGSDGENGNWDTQSCEILAVKSFRNNTVAASVYGLVYTSPNPLVTYNSQFNSATGNIEITAVAAQSNGVYVRVHAIEISTAD